MNSQICKISEIMEDIKQNITDNQYKIIMDSLMEIKNGKIETKINPCIYTQNEFDEELFLIIKLSIDNIFEYTDDENDVCWFNSIENIIRSKLHDHRIGFMDDELEEHILGILLKKTK